MKEAMVSGPEEGGEACPKGREKEKEKSTGHISLQGLIGLPPLTFPFPWIVPSSLLCLSPSLQPARSLALDPL